MKLLRIKRKAIPMRVLNTNQICHKIKKYLFQYQALQSPNFSSFCDLGKDHKNGLT